MRPLAYWLPAAALVTMVAAVSPSTSAQAPSAIDFARDVQPLLRANCYGCHGETLQNGNFRLDRRRDSMPNRVGANGARIVPGNSASSRLYIRVAGNQGGLQMPPTGALRPEDIATIKTWIDQGAAWPDELDGERPTPPRNPLADQLLEAIRRGERRHADRLLKEHPETAREPGTGGTTALMQAALYGDAATARRLLDLGASVNARNDAGASALLWAVDDLAMTRLLLDRGADPNVVSVDQRTPLAVAAGRYGASPIVRLLLDRGARLERQPLLTPAADAGDAATIRLLLDRGVDTSTLPNDLAIRSGCADCTDILLGIADASSLERALPSAGRFGGPGTVERLLARGARPTPLALRAVASSESLDADAAAALLARGVRDEQAMALAAGHGETPVVAALRKAGVADVTRPLPTLRRPAEARSARAAIDASLPPLQRADTRFLQTAGCVSCHHNSLFQMTASAVRPLGIRIDETAVRDQMASTRAYLASWRERVIQDIGIPGQIDTVAYILAGLADTDYAPDAATDALARYVKRRQAADGRWPVASGRPPLESSTIAITAVAMRSLRAFAPAPLKGAYDDAVKRGAAWLAAAKPKTTEDRAFMLLGLAWAREHEAATRAVARDLVAQQRSDGGWSQLPTLTSDAYATGQVLVALLRSGAVKPGDEVYRRGVRFLLDSQLEDGSWFIRSRAVPIQPYFDSGFPHGPDQFISAAATNWATIALAGAAK